MITKLFPATNKIFLWIVLIQTSLIAVLSIYIIYKRQRILGVTISNPIPKESIESNPTSTLRFFYEPKPNTKEIVNEWGPYNGTYLINSDSLNERFDYTVKKVASTYRIVTLGDSYTYGLYVNTEDNWSEKLEDMLNTRCDKYKNYEVINLGVHGYDLQYASERFRIRGQKYHPDFVLWLIKDDDLLQVNEVMFEKLQKYLPEGKESEPWNKAYKETYDELGFKQIIAYQEDVLNRFFSLYLGDIGIMTFPHMKRFSTAMFSNSFSRAENVEMIPLEDIYVDSSMFYKDDLHPTSNGHRVIAEDVLNFFQKKNICN